MTIWEGKVHIQLKILKNLFSYSFCRCVWKRTTDKSKAPGFLLLFRWYFFKSLKWHKIKSLWKVDGLTYNSIRPDSKTEKGTTSSLSMIINSLKLQKYHLVNYLFWGIKWHHKELKKWSVYPLISDKIHPNDFFFFSAGVWYT